MYTVEDAHLLGVEILTSRYSGFPRRTMEMFLLSVPSQFISSGGAPFFTALLHLLFFTSSDDVIYMYQFCVLHVDCPF